MRRVEDCQGWRGAVDFELFQSKSGDYSLMHSLDDNEKALESSALAELCLKLTIKEPRFPHTLPNMYSFQLHSVSFNITKHEIFPSSARR